MKHSKSVKIRLVPKIRDMTYMEYEYSDRMIEPREEKPVQVIFEMSWDLFPEKRKVR